MSRANSFPLREWHFYAVFGLTIFLAAVALYWQEQAEVNFSRCPLCGQASR